jgi:peptidoglycan/LPS O-acetylase OafA/YrhL
MLQDKKSIGFPALFLFLGMKWSVTVNQFSREESRFLKGIAILMIVLHNYYRWVHPITGENEFHFDPDFIIRSWIFLRTNPLELFHVFFNFLGHYGVQAFIVISAYGLTRSWITRQPSYGRYILHRFEKLYPSLVFAGLIFVLYTLVATGSLISAEQWKNLGIQLTLFANLVPGKAMAISGPWWFYSFIFGFYLVFPLMFLIARKSVWFGLPIMVVIGYLFSILLYQPMTSIELNPYMFFLGHMPELCLGIFLALRPQFRIPYYGLLMAAFLLVGGNIWAWLWPFANLGVALLLVVGIQALSRIRHRFKGLYRLIAGVGTISMYLFACHGFMRSPFINLANTLQGPIASLVIGLVFVVFASGIAYLMMQTETTVRQWIAEPKIRTRKTGRFFLLMGMIALALGFLFFKDYRVMASLPEKQEEVPVYSIEQNFEVAVEGRWDQFSDTLVYEGKKSLVLNRDHAFSPAIEVDFDAFDLEGVVAYEAKAKLFTKNPNGSVHLVTEVSEKATGARLEWMSEFIKPGTFETGKWIDIRFRIHIPAHFRHKNFLFKSYLWIPDGTDWCADALQVRVMGSPHRHP